MKKFKLMGDFTLDGGHLIDIGLRDCNGCPVHWLDVVRVYHRRDGVYDMHVLYDDTQAAFCYCTFEVRQVANPPGWDRKHHKTDSRGFLIHYNEPLVQMVRDIRTKWCRIEVLGHINRVFQGGGTVERTWNVEYQFGGNIHGTSKGFQLPQVALAFAFKHISEAHELDPKIMEGNYYEQETN